MKRTLAQFLIVITFCISACSKKSDLDEQGRLIMTALHTENGSFAFEPMRHTDSASVIGKQPGIYTYHGEPFTGTAAAYNDKGNLIIEGYFVNGIQNGNWKFYTLSGKLLIEGNYLNGFESGIWTSYYTGEKPKIKMFFDDKGFMLMRTEFYDSGRVKNYQNIKCPQYGNRERRIEFTYDGKIEYLDAEREIGMLPPQDINLMLKSDALYIKP